MWDGDVTSSSPLKASTEEVIGQPEMGQRIDVTLAPYPALLPFPFYLSPPTFLLLSLLLLSSPSDLYTHVGSARHAGDSEADGENGVEVRIRPRSTLCAVCPACALVSIDCPAAPREKGLPVGPGSHYAAWSLRRYCPSYDMSYDTSYDTR